MNNPDNESKPKQIKLSEKQKQRIALKACNAISHINNIHNS